MTRKSMSFQSTNNNENAACDTSETNWMTRKSMSFQSTNNNENAVCDTSETNWMTANLPRTKR